MQDPISVQEAAKLLGVNESQVRRYIYAGLLPARDLGKQWLLDRGDVMNFVRPKPGNPNFRKKISG